MAKRSVKVGAVAGRVARCRVCHREMTDAAHIAAGIGPICAAKALRAGTRSASAAPERGAYPAERYTRIQKSVAKLVSMLDEAYEYRAAAYRIGTPAQRVTGDEAVALVAHWTRRWSAMERRAHRLMTYGKRA